MLGIVAWFVWILVLLLAATAALAVAAAAGGWVVGVPLGASHRLRRGTWPQWFGPLMHYSLWTTAVAAVALTFIWLFLAGTG